MVRAIGCGLLFALGACAPAPKEAPAGLPPPAPPAFDAGSTVTPCDVPLAGTLPPGAFALGGSTVGRPSAYDWACDDDEGKGSEVAYDFDVAVDATLRLRISAEREYWALGLLERSFCAQPPTRCDTDYQGLIFDPADLSFAGLKGSYRVLVDSDERSGEFLLSGSLLPDHGGAACTDAGVFASPGSAWLSPFDEAEGPNAAVGSAVVARFLAPDSPRWVEIEGEPGTPGWFRDSCLGPIKRRTRMLLDAGQSVLGYAFASSADAGFATVYGPHDAAAQSSCQSPERLSAAPVAIRGSTLGSTDAVSSGCGADGGAKDLTFELDLLESADLALALDSDFDAVLRIAQGCVELACAAQTTAGDVELRRSLSPGRYQVTVDGRGQAGGTFTLLSKIVPSAVGGAPSCGAACTGTTPYCIDGQCRACYTAAHCGNPLAPCCSALGNACSVAIGSCLP